MKQFWNNGDPQGARIKGSGNQQKLTMPDGSILMGGLNDIPDLYEVTEIGGKPSQYQIETDQINELIDDKIVKTKTLGWRPLVDIQDIKITSSAKTKGLLLTESDWEVIAEADSARSPGKPRSMSQATKDKRLAIITAHDDFEIAIGLETDPATLADMQPSFPVDEEI